MKYDQFVATVRDRGEYRSATEAGQVAESVLQVLSAVADAVSGGELNQVLSQLPSGYAALFGKVDLS